MTFEEKYLTVPEPVVVAGRTMKRYYVTTDLGPMSAPVEEAALAMLPELLPSPDDDTVPTGFLVLQLPPLGHERSAFVRHVLMPDQPDLAGYVADSMSSGRVGGP